MKTAIRVRKELLWFVRGRSNLLRRRRNVNRLGRRFVRQRFPQRCRQRVQFPLVVLQRAVEVALESEIRLEQRGVGRAEEDLALRRQRDEVRAAVVRIWDAARDPLCDEPLDVVAQRRHRDPGRGRDRRRRGRLVVADVRRQREQVYGQSDRGEVLLDDLRDVLRDRGRRQEEVPVGHLDRSYEPFRRQRRRRPEYDRAMARYLHTMYRITDPERSRAFYEALGMELRRDMDIVRGGEKEATNYFLGFAGQDEELELTFNHDGSTYELGTGYGHVAVGVDDLDGTLQR